jgi:hypothetical protein
VCFESCADLFAPAIVRFLAEGFQQLVQHGL